MQAGEEEVYVKFCMVHLIRTLMRRTSTHPKTFRTMLHALNKTTRIGARQLVEEAIAGAPPLIGTYLDNYWNRASDIESWSMAARQHSPILLQVTSTNALESYHRLVKGPGKCTKRCSLLKACRALVKVNNQRWLEADRTATTFRTKALKHLNAYPEIGKFPYPIQRLLIDQYMAVEKRIAKAKPIPELQGECHCLFARKYLLPCKHVFHADSCSDTRILTPELWNSYIIMFEESGYEVYEGKEKVTVPVVLPEIDRARDSRKRKVKAAGEEIMNFYFRLEDQIADQDPLAAGKLDNFIADLQSFTTSNTVYTFHL
ncbi:hypothetical protein DFS34DRAFT_629484 [Phlyctochytrium arcticum]|nr:hypothetical protein DFS34DRAFT_629484 [Phlyctochytrium arcticum]